MTYCVLGFRKQKQGRYRLCPQEAHRDQVKGRSPRSSEQRLLIHPAAIGHSFRRRTGCLL